MTQYVDKSLATGETIVARGRWPIAYWLGAWAALLLLWWIVLGVVIFALMWLHMKTTQFAVTNQRVVLKRGWITLHTQELAVGNIEEVRLEQTLLGRLFGFGRVIVTGTGEGVILFPPMAHPIDFRRAIENARTQARGGPSTPKH
jgi:uncharacterized membrane protein YdbT with pleckstrin-like domain